MVYWKLKCVLSSHTLILTIISKCNMPHNVGLHWSQLSVLALGPHQSQFKIFDPNPSTALETVSPSSHTTLMSSASSSVVQRLGLAINWPLVPAPVPHQSKLLVPALKLFWRQCQDWDREPSSCAGIISMEQLYNNWPCITNTIWRYSSPVSPYFATYDHTAWMCGCSCFSLWDSEMSVFPQSTRHYP